MKYTDRYDAPVETPLDLIKIFVSSIFMSPLRLYMDVSRKIMYLPSEELKYVLHYSWIGLGITFVINLAVQIISRKIYLFSGVVPLTVNIVTMLICLGCEFLVDKFYNDSSVTMIKRSASEISDLEKSADKQKAKKNVTKEDVEDKDELKDFDIDSLDNNGPTMSDLLGKLPKKNMGQENPSPDSHKATLEFIDDVFKEDKISQDRIPVRPKETPVKINSLADKINEYKKNNADKVKSIIPNIPLSETQKVESDLAISTNKYNININSLPKEDIPKQSYEYDSSDIEMLDDVFEI